MFIPTWIINLFSREANILICNMQLAEALGIVTKLASVSTALFVNISPFNKLKSLTISFMSNTIWYPVYKQIITISLHADRQWRCIGHWRWLDKRCDQWFACFTIKHCHLSIKINWRVNRSYMQHTWKLSQFLCRCRQPWKESFSSLKLPIWVLSFFFTFFSQTFYSLSHFELRLAPQIVIIIVGKSMHFLVKTDINHFRVKLNQFPV